MENQTLKFEKLVYGGDCLGRLPDGRAVFAPFILPGEVAEVEIREEKDRFLRAHLVKILEASPDRIEAPCPYFTQCGGCHYQHLDYAQQLATKKELLIDQLQRIGKFQNLPDFQITPSKLPFAYRNQIQLHPVLPELIENENPEETLLALGFKRASSNDTIPIKKCLLAPDDINSLLGQIELETDSGITRLAMRIDSDGELMLVFEGDGDQAPDLSFELPISSTFLYPDGESLNLSGNDALIYEVMGKEFLVSPESFFQVNLNVAEEMLRYVLDLLYGQIGLNILELYSGVGLFSRFLAPLAKQLTAIEASPSACFDFVSNLEEFENVSLYEGPVESLLPDLIGQIESPDLVLLDPPRAGLHVKARQALLKLSPKQIIYISCDPSTLARDLKALHESGYQLESLQAFDMFPQTAHVETMTVLRRTQRVTS